MSSFADPAGRSSLSLCSLLRRWSRPPSINRRHPFPGWVAPAMATASAWAMTASGCLAWMRPNWPSNAPVPRARRGHAAEPLVTAWRNCSLPVRPIAVRKISISMIGYWPPVWLPAAILVVPWWPRAWRLPRGATGPRRRQPAATVWGYGPVTSTHRVTGATIIPGRRVRGAGWRPSDSRLTMRRCRPLTSFAQDYC
jgi:hypothetical protein